MKSPALAEFLNSLGKTQHHVHTAIIGLAAVEEGVASRPPDLDIAWAVADSRGAARESRQFVLRSSLVFAAETLSRYATTHVNYLRLAYPELQLPDNAADRIRMAGERAAVEPEYLTVAAVLLRQWRNRIVHRGSDARLSRREEAILRNNANEIADRVKHLDVEQLLDDFEHNRPTLKETTSLLSISIRFARVADAHLPSIESPDEVTRWLQLLDLDSSVLNLERQAANGGSKDPRRPVRQFLVTKAPTLADAYYRMGHSLTIV